MKIESHDRTIEQLLRGNYYSIPRFQRPYSWGVQQLEDFWDDVVVESDEDYFIGAVVVFPGSGEALEVVDGQQRLTTITVTLAAIRDLFDSLGETDLALGVQGFIERPDRRNTNQFVLKTQTSYPYLQGRIQSYPATGESATTKPEEEALAYARSFFDEKLAGVRVVFLGDAADPSASAIRALIERVEVIRDQVLRLSVVHIEVDSEDNAYVIFETLNTRGLELSLSDLIRNFLLRGLRNPNADLDLARDRFNEILQEFDQSQASIDSSVFFHHYWISKNDYVARKNVFRTMKKKTKAADKQALLEELVADSKRYRAIREPTSREWRKEEASMVRSLRALDVFGMALPLPLFLALLRSYDDKVIKLGLLRRALNAIESFHFQFTAVAGRSSSGGITKMYALHARTVRNASDAREVAQSIEQLTKKLRSMKPTEDEFVAGFKEIEYSSEFTRQKRLVQYALGRILRESLAGSALGGTDHLTIEHLAPESGSKVPAESIRSIGNLLIVPESLNVKLANKSFRDKKPLLLEADGVFVDGVLRDAGRWDSRQIEKRAVGLALLSYRDVWSF